MQQTDRKRQAEKNRRNADNVGHGHTFEQKKLQNHRRRLVRFNNKNKNYPKTLNLGAGERKQGNWLSATPATLLVVEFRLYVVARARSPATVCWWNNCRQIIIIFIIVVVSGVKTGRDRITSLVDDSTTRQTTRQNFIRSPR